jgi:hypothetical protein
MARGTLIQLSVHNCNPQSVDCLLFEAPPPRDRWFHTTVEACESRTDPFALGRLWEEEQKQMAVMVKGVLN